ncbi:hypothetical protein [Sporosarcina beigongshangi]|nr:hypothetical protein [Sporosarcina beigongshangi]
MMDFVNLHAIMDNYRRQTQRRRMTSGEKRALSLRKEDQRLNGQKS